MDIAIVGAGISGLSAGIELTRLGHSVEIYESSDGPGGRVRTDSVDGKLLDRGFQILLTAYPEAQRVLDYEALDLRSFQPGALVRHAGNFHRVTDPIREPKQLLTTVRAPIGSLTDKVRTLKFRREVCRGEVEQLWTNSPLTAQQRFEKLGFSSQMIDRFLRPLFAGITLDPELSGSASVVDFVFRMLSLGSAAVPARGMGQISLQLANQLPDGTVNVNHTVEQVRGTELIVNGETVKADAVLVAADISTANRLCPEVHDVGWKSTTSVWFAAESAPLLDPVLVLNGGSTDPINSLAVMSRVSPFYGTDGEATIVISSPVVRPGLVEDMQEQLVDWYGKKTKLWNVLRVDEIHKAQPKSSSGQRSGFVRLPDGIWICGDHTLDSSINGALRSGRLAAQAIAAESTSAKA